MTTSNTELAAQARKLAEMIQIYGQTLDPRFLGEAADALRQLADALESKGEPVHPNHRSALRYVLATLNDCNANLKMKAELRERVQASIVGMRYVISRAVAAPAQPEKDERKPLTDADIEKLRQATFSTNNPFCPVDSKSMRKAVLAAERAHGIGSSTEGGEHG